MRPVAFGEALPGGTRLTLFSNDKPDHFFTVIKFWMDETSGVALALKNGVPNYQVVNLSRRIGRLRSDYIVGGISVVRIKIKIAMPELSAAIRISNPCCIS
jgi:hypothetical protein